MKIYKLIIIVFLLTSIGLCAQSSYEITDPVQSEGWTNNAEKVFNNSKENGNPILLNFTGSDWCVWCKKIKKEIFDTPEFKEWVKNNNVELLELDFPKRISQSQELKSQNVSLAREMGVRGYPTIIIIANGKAVKTGYVKGGPENWIKSVESQIDL
ncbi:MAG: thioredoxin family protein [Bacteroidetes bacterium]|nr:thioredoxin family protein [Bacteroidota bacterium]|tara:strand:+ start:9659 stop:10126 length:468 start_codon:yes stop_codon:yes gene_type:complete